MTNSNIRVQINSTTIGQCDLQFMNQLIAGFDWILNHLKVSIYWLFYLFPYFWFIFNILTNNIDRRLNKYKINSFVYITCTLKIATVTQHSHKCINITTITFAL